MSEPLRALVLEDEWPARNYLVQLLERSGLAHVVAAVPQTALATEALSAPDVGVEVAFVDIHLAGERDAERAGIGWIEGLKRADGPAPLVVLTTAVRDHALRAYELGVVDYLLKPFTEARVAACLEKVSRLAASTARAHAAKPFDGRIAARQGRSIVFLRREEAYAFEAEGRLCYVHTARGRLDIDLSLTALEALLGAPYLRVHRTWLVALDAVQSMERDGGESVLLVGPGEPPLRVSVARERTAIVKERLLQSAIGLRREG
jgi:two-component system, LytTR family, response regulator LytT